MIKNLLIFLLLLPLLTAAQAPTNDSTKLSGTTKSITLGSLYSKGANASNTQIGFLNPATGKWVQLVTGYQFNHFGGGGSIDSTRFIRTHGTSDIFGDVVVNTTPTTSFSITDFAPYNSILFRSYPFLGANGNGIGAYFNTYDPSFPIDYKYIARLNIQDDFIELKTVNQQSNKLRSFVLKDDSTNIFRDDYGKGLQYFANYHATYTTRSLVDKSYVDSIATGIGGAYWPLGGSASLTSNNTINSGNNSFSLGKTNVGGFTVAVPDTTTGQISAFVGNLAANYASILSIKKDQAAMLRSKLSGTYFKQQGFLAGVASNYAIGTKLGIRDDYNHAGVQYFGTIDTAKMNDSTLVHRKYLWQYVLNHSGGTYSAGYGLGLTGTTFRADSTILVNKTFFNSVVGTTTLARINAKYGPSDTTSTLATKSYTNRYPLKSTTIAGFDLRNNITFANHTNGYGISGSAYNASTGQTWVIDTAGTIVSKNYNNTVIPTTTLARINTKYGSSDTTSTLVTKSFAGRYVTTNSNASLNSLSLLQTASPTYSRGRLFYDTGNESLTFFNNDSNIGLQVGQEEWVQVKNATGSTIANGAAVYINGSSSGIPTIALAQANSGATTIGIGLATESIANGAIGYVTALGVVHGLNTSSFAVGPIYIDPTTAGALTQTAPAAPNFRYRVGFVTVVDATVGAIHVTPSTAALGNGTANQLFGMNAAGTAQETKSVVGSAATGAVVTHSANTITLSNDTTVVQSVNNLFPKSDTRYYTKTATDAKYLDFTSAQSATGVKTLTAVLRPATISQTPLGTANTDSVMVKIGSTGKMGAISPTAFGGGGTPANPTGSVGLTAVNGSATTYMRSDAAPALSQSIAPTWTGTHTFSNSAPIIFSGSTPVIDFNNSGTIRMLNGPMTFNGAFNVVNNMVSMESPGSAGSIAGQIGTSPFGFKYNLFIASANVGRADLIQGIPSTTVAGAHTLLFYQGSTSNTSATGGSATMSLYHNGTVGLAGFQKALPTSWIDIGAGTSTVAPFGFTSGTDLSSPLAGKWYYNGTRLGFSPSTTIKRVALTNDAAPANGQIPIGNATDYTVANITQGSGITVTNGAGSITIANSAFRAAQTISAASTLTLAYGIDYVFSGTTATYTLPAISGATNGDANRITIYNRGSGSITVNSAAAGNDIYKAGATNTFTLTSGSACTLTPDGVYHLYK